MLLNLVGEFDFPLLRDTQQAKGASYRTHLNPTVKLGPPPTHVGSVNNHHPQLADQDWAAYVQVYMYTFEKAPGRADAYVPYGRLMLTLY